MTANMQDYNNPKLPRCIKGGEGGWTQFHTNQELNTLLTTQQNYSQAAHAMGRPLTAAKDLTIETTAAECTHHR